MRVSSLWEHAPDAAEPGMASVEGVNRSSFHERLEELTRKAQQLGATAPIGL